MTNSHHQHDGHCKLAIRKIRKMHCAMCSFILQMEFLICSTKCSLVYLTQVLGMGGFITVCLQFFLETEQFMLRLMHKKMQSILIL